MTELVVISRPKDNPAHSHIEGRGYGSKKEAEKMINVFRDRVSALDEVQKKHNLGYPQYAREYAVAMLTIPTEESWK